MDPSYFDGINEKLFDKRKPRCFPNKLQTFKAPLLPFPDTPPRDNNNGDSQSYEFYGENEILKNEPEKTQFHPITHWRRAEFYDEMAVTKLIQHSEFPLNDLFGEPDVPNLIEKSSFAMVQFNSIEKLISFMSVFSYPDIPAVPAFEWFNWLDKSYRLKHVNPRNCFFIHYIAWDSEYTNDFLKLSLETIFLENTFLNYLIITKPPKVDIPKAFRSAFVQILPLDATFYECGVDSFQTLLVCLRHSLLERLKIRLAMVEDHDDLMPIMEQHTDRLRELYGDFCMAEIIEYPGTKDRKTLVCESMGYAVGFMNLNSSIDLELLNCQFDLGVFNGLKKPSEYDVIPETCLQDEGDEPIYLPNTIDPFLEIVDSETMLKLLNWKPSLCASKEEIESESKSSEGLGGYNKLGSSMSFLLRETLNVKLAPKFSAHALSLVESEGKSSYSSFSGSGAPFTELSVVEESQVLTESSLISLQYYNLPTYNGPPNAFCIEFYAMHSQFDDRLCHNFLEAAFKAFPDLEYCLLTIPSQAPAFPLLDLFTRVTPRPLKRFKQELYVCHKSSITITFMRVRRIVKSDLKDIYQLLSGIKNREFIYSDIASSCYYEDTAYQGFVLICSKSIVGVAVLCNEDGMEYLAHHYQVSDLIDFELHKIDYHAILKHLVLSPVYQPHARFFLRDIMRLADVTSLYRARYEETESNWNKSSVITVLDQLIPVKPRRMVKYHEPSLGQNTPPPYFLHRDLPFSLYHINSRVCGVKKFTSNMNVVVVGSSRTAFSFLQTLLFAPSSAYVTYNNITLVSPHGMGTELPSHPARDIMFPFEGKFSRFYKIQLCLKTYVHFVYGVMTQINRVDKYITINNESVLPYDYLILLCGRQFVMPIPSALMVDSRECRRNYRPRCSLFKYLVSTQSKETDINYVYPPNVFLINTDVDATNAFISLHYLIQKRQGFPEDEKIIIYGHNISTFLCASALLKFGVPPQMIVIVEPFPSGTFSTSCLLDANIDAAVLKSLAELKIDHYRASFLYDWTLSENKQVKTVEFHSAHRRITLKCLAMFPFERKMVSDVTFKAVNEASLVYDGKLVIDSCFQTNDKYIYAAGSLTKYRRKYYAKDKNHKNYNSNELAKIVRKKIDPTEGLTPDNPPEIVPHMTEPLVLHGILPGDWNYFVIRKPGKPQHPDTRSRIKEFGDVLITGDCAMSKGYGYFKLILDECGFVEGIFCYTKYEIDTTNLEMLYGKHEKLLNDLLLRFDSGMINDFYSYFREPWVYAIMQDRFKFVLEENHQLFCNETPPFGKQRIMDMVVNALKESNWERPKRDKILEIKETFDDSKVKQDMKENILDFLYYFDEAFPMYATPRILRVLLHDANTSLLHKTTQDQSASSKGGVRLSEMVRRL